ncbi:XRE family transcriptional regulator [Kineosporia sp. A_224]|uniref:ImmA/IrrE family metallo-endopeptidase n=1 Tax=Kineosporia sp. A_224 TaxID=1962180 RepID=UPI0018E95E2A
MNDESPLVIAARRRRASGVADGFDGERLALARRLARMPRTVVARHLGVSPAAITQFERGHARPTMALLAQMSLTLGVPREFFRLGRPVKSLPATSAHFRSLRATPALVRDQALAFAELGLEVAGVIEQYVDLPTVSLPDCVVDGDPSPETVVEAARRTRTALGVPAGPIAHMVRLLEAAGILVLWLPESKVDRRVDAFSTTAGRRPLVLLSPLKDDKARSRFDAAHELGHIVMHADAEPGSKLLENQAQSFASEFLMPSEQVVDDLPRRLDWESLLEAKRRWGTSLRSLVFRAHWLGVMSESTYRRANQQLALWGNPEPGPLGPPETASLLGLSLGILAAHGTTLDEIASASGLPAEHIRLVVAAATDTRPRVHLTTP